MPRTSADSTTIGGTTPEVAPEVIPEVTKILPLCATAKSEQERQLAVGIRDEKHFREAYLRPNLEAGLLERTTPEKLQSSKQRYRLTAKGAGMGTATRLAIGCGRLAAEGQRQSRSAQ